MVRLDFLVPGFAKCGTTSLCALLGEHPSIFMPRHKDFRLFDLPDYERRWTQFEHRFDDAPGDAVIGEGSIWYTDAECETRARQRILDHFPEIRLVFIVRDPIDRIAADFRERHHSGAHYAAVCPFDLRDALAAVPAMIENTRYATRLETYQRHVPAERILVVFLEELVAHPEAQLARCFRFLGVDADVAIPEASRRLNPGTAKSHDTPRWRELRRRPEIAAALKGIPLAVREQLLPHLGLRVPFASTEPAWSVEARGLVVGRIAEETRAFLASQGKPLALWPRFAAALEAS